jgi:hypothetical protein
MMVLKHSHVDIALGTNGTPRHKRSVAIRSEKIATLVHTGEKIINITVK